LGQIRDGNSQIAEAAIQSIFAGGDPVECRAVADYFQNLPPEIRRNEIAAALRRSMGRDASLALVVSAMESKDEEWKSIVREALLMHADADVLQQLVDRFDATPDNAGREFLVGTVEQMQKSEAIDPLMHLAEGLRTTGLEEDAMAWAAVRALAKIGTAPATLALYSLMDRTEDPTTRGALGTTLSTITSPEAIPALQAAAHGGKDAQRPETRVAAVYALSRQDREAAGVALQELATVQDKDINEAARTALLAFEENQIVRRTK
jgi:HEAT repeat protein